MVSHTRFGAKAPRLQRRRYEKTQTEMLAKKGAGETRGQERRGEREEDKRKKRRKEREAGKKREAEAGKQKGSKRHNKINLTKLEQDEKTL